MHKMTVHQLILLVALLLLADPAAAGKKKKAQPKPDEVEIPLDSPPVHSSEANALGQLAGHEKMKGMKIGKRTIAADGKSGQIMLEPEDGAEKERWTPTFRVTLNELRRRVETEDLVLALFMSSAEEHIGQSHTNGKAFDEAAHRINELDDYEVSLLLVDLEQEKDNADSQQLLREYGAKDPHTYKLFVNGKPTSLPPHSRVDADGLVNLITERAGPPSTKIESAEALDALLGNASSTVVVGIFGPAYQGAASRELYSTAARELRETDRLRFVEVGTRVANLAKIFAADKDHPFDTGVSVYAVVRSLKWLGKSETRYFTSTDFRKIHAFVAENSFTKICRFSESLVTHAKRARPIPKGQKPMPRMLATLLFNSVKQPTKLRYIVKQVRPSCACKINLSRLTLLPCFPSLHSTTSSSTSCHPTSLTPTPLLSLTGPRWSLTPGLPTDSTARRSATRM